MDSFELEESKAEAAATLCNSSQLALAALASGTSMAQTRRRLMAHIADAPLPSDSNDEDVGNERVVGINSLGGSGPVMKDVHRTTSAWQKYMALRDIPQPVSSARIVVRVTGGGKCKEYFTS